MKILFIGNSFTGRHDLPGLVTALAAGAARAKAVHTESVLANGASLRQHWNAGTALRRIEEEAWDYVVLQEQSTLPIKNAGRFHENVRLFDTEIGKRGAKTLLYLTWARSSAPGTQVNLNEATLEIAKDIGAVVAPVGNAWQSVLRARPDIQLYDKDGSHPSPAGSYLAACVFYGVLFNETPPPGVAPHKLKLDPADALFLRAIADENSISNF